MRKIEQNTLNAIINDIKQYQTDSTVQGFKSGNMEVHVGKDPYKLVIRLHGNVIGIINIVERTLALTLAGYPTRTTISRLNVLLVGLTHDNRGYRTINFNPYLGSTGKITEDQPVLTTGYEQFDLSNSLYL